MKVQFFCPKCGNEFNTPKRDTGLKISCPGCATDVIVPPPSYDMAAAMAVLLYTAGGITMVVGLFILISTSIKTDADRLLAAAGCILSGMSIFGLAAIIGCVRDIARNTAFLHPIASRPGAEQEEGLSEPAGISDEDDARDNSAAGDGESQTDPADEPDDSDEPNENPERPANQIRT